MNENKLKEELMNESNKITIKTTSEQILNKFYNQEVDSFNNAPLKSSFLSKIFLSFSAAAVIGITVGSYFLGNYNKNESQYSSESLSFENDISTETVLQVYSAATLISDSSNNTLKQNKYSLANIEQRDNTEYRITSSDFTTIATKYNLVNNTIDSILTYEENNETITIDKGSYNGQKNDNSFSYKADMSKIDADTKKSFIFTTYSSSDNDQFYFDGEISLSEDSSYECDGYIFNDQNKDDERTYGGKPGDFIFGNWNDPFANYHEETVNLDINVYIDDNSYINVTKTSDGIENTYVYSMYENDEDIYDITICYNKDVDHNNHQRIMAEALYEDDSNIVYYSINLEDLKDNNFIEFLYKDCYGVFYRYVEDTKVSYTYSYWQGREKMSYSVSF